MAGHSFVSLEEIWPVVVSIYWPDELTARCLRSHQNVGLDAAQEIGLRGSQGVFITNLDSDELWHPDKVAGLSVHA